MKEQITQIKNSNYETLIQQISQIVNNNKKQLSTTINNVLIETYWNIGKYIVEYEQAGDSRAEYGKNLLINLSHDLTIRLGKGYSKSNLFNMRLFYQCFPIFQAVPGKLSWTILVEIIRIENELERNFYIIETINQIGVQGSLYITKSVVYFCN